MGKKGIWFSAFFAAFGLLFAAIGGWFWHSDAQLAGMGERAPGVVTGFAMMGWQIKRQRTISWLKTQGTPIDAEFLECYHDTSFKVNGRSPWRVTAQAIHPATGKLAVFKSEAIWANPAAFLQGKPVRVLIDPKDPKRHYIELDHILGESALG